MKRTLVLFLTIVLIFNIFAVTCIEAQALSVLDVIDIAGEAMTVVGLFDVADDMIQYMRDIGYLTAPDGVDDDSYFGGFGGGSSRGGGAGRQFWDDRANDAYDDGLGSTPDYSGEAYLKYIDSTVENDSTVYRYQICNCLSVDTNSGTNISASTDGSYMEVNHSSFEVGGNGLIEALFSYDFSNIILPEAQKYTLRIVVDEFSLDAIEDDGYGDAAYIGIDNQPAVTNETVLPFVEYITFYNQLYQTSHNSTYFHFKSYNAFTAKAHVELKIYSPTSSSVPTSTTSYDSSTRIHDESLTYAYENSNNETSIVDDHSIVSETNNEWYNPVEDTTYNMDGWTYDYSTRTYNIDYTDGDGESQQAEVTYGSNNMTITSGGTTTTYSYVMSQDTYNNYYGSGSGTDDPEPTPTPTPDSGGGSGGGSGSGDGDDDEDDGGGLLDFLKALADVIGNILEFLLKPLELLLELIAQVIEKITDAFDISDEFIEAMTGLWGIFPAEITALIVAGLALIIVFAIIKIFLK